MFSGGVIRTLLAPPRAGRGNAQSPRPAHYVSCDRHRRIHRKMFGTRTSCPRCVLIRRTSPGQQIRWVGSSGHFTHTRVRRNPMWPGRLTALGAWGHGPATMLSHRRVRRGDAVRVIAEFPPYRRDNAATYYWFRTCRKNPGARLPPVSIRLPVATARARASAAAKASSLSDQKRPLRPLLWGSYLILLDRNLARGLFIWRADIRAQ